MCIPKYLTDGDSGINMLLKKIGGHWFFLNVNITCVDMVSFILIFHSVNKGVLCIIHTVEHNCIYVLVHKEI